MVEKCFMFLKLIIQSWLSNISYYQIFSQYISTYFNIYQVTWIYKYWIYKKKNLEMYTQNIFKQKKKNSKEMADLRQCNACNNSIPQIRFLSHADTSISGFRISANNLRDRFFFLCYYYFLFTASLSHFTDTVMNIFHISCSRTDLKKWERAKHFPMPRKLVILFFGKKYFVRQTRSLFLTVV